MFRSSDTASLTDLTIGFTGKTLDPHAEKRDETTLPAALHHPAAKFLLFTHNRIILRQDENDTHTALLSLAEIKKLCPVSDINTQDSLVLLGEADGTAYLALEAENDIQTLPANIQAAEYRALYTHNLLEPALAGMVAQAAALLAWHRTHRFCGRCGHKTEMRIGGFKRLCTACHAEHFPRTDPVVIMLVIRNTALGEQCLLARGAHFAPHTYSCLAGFVEPGETVENAVRREVREEASLTVGRVIYHASQPWPFPYSLMLGCFAQSLSDDLRLDPDEIGGRALVWP